MTNNVRLKFKRNGMYDIRRSPDVIGFLEGKGELVVDAANETLDERNGYRMSSSQGARRPYGRWAVRVFTSSNHAKRSNAIRNTLIRALDKAR